MTQRDRKGAASEAGPGLAATQRDRKGAAAEAGPGLAATQRDRKGAAAAELAPTGRKQRGVDAPRAQQRPALPARARRTGASRGEPIIEPSAAEHVRNRKAQPSVERTGSKRTSRRRRPRRDASR